MFAKQATTGSVIVGARRVPTDDMTSVRVTRDYDRFKFDLSNRSLNEQHVKRLMNSIKEKNLLAAYPIIVDHNNTVIDGQHRLIAAKRLGVAVYYIVSDAIGVDDITRINADVEHWTNDDYLHYYVRQGNRHYVAILMTAKKWGVKLSTIMNTMGLSRPGNMSISEAFKRGQINADNIGKFDDFMKMASDLDPYIGDRSRLYVFLSAFRYVSSLPGYDHNTMLKRAETQQREFVTCTSASAYIDMLVDIYNYHTFEKNRLVVPRRNRR